MKTLCDHVVRVENREEAFMAACTMLAKITLRGNKGEAEWHWSFDLARHDQFPCIITYCAKGLGHVDEKLIFNKA